MGEAFKRDDEEEIYKRLLALWIAGVAAWAEPPTANVIYHLLLTYRQEREANAAGTGS